MKSVMFVVVAMLAMVSFAVAGESVTPAVKPAVQAQASLVKVPVKKAVVKKAVVKKAVVKKAVEKKAVVKKAVEKK